MFQQLEISAFDILRKKWHEIDDWMFLNPGKVGSIIFWTAIFSAIIYFVFA